MMGLCYFSLIYVFLVSNENDYYNLWKLSKIGSYIGYAMLIWEFDLC